MTWLLLTPIGVEVEVRTSAAITEPILVTAEQIQAVALAAAQMIENGLEVDVGQLLTRMCRRVDPAQQVMMFGSNVGPGPPLEQAYQTAPEDGRSWLCACGKGWSVATGGEMALKRHQATCGVVASLQIPPDRRVD